MLSNQKIVFEFHSYLMYEQDLSPPIYTYICVSIDKAARQPSINVCVCSYALLRPVRCAISSIPQTQSNRNRSSSSYRLRILHLASVRRCSSGQQASVGREAVSADHLG
jgi:hypothetical protein